MPAFPPEALQPVALRRQGAGQLIIDWKDGHHSVYSWGYLRAHCPCATCREERLKPPDPFRILNEKELVPLAPVAVSPVGHYAYKITWSDGHDSGIYTLEALRELCQCSACRPHAVEEPGK
jgi:DUF971 family protein